MNFNNYLKAVIQEVGNGDSRNDCNSLLGNHISNETAELLKKIAHLMMETDFTREDTKQYLSSKISSYRQVHKVDGCSQNSSTTATRKLQDIDKLKKVLSEEFFDELIVNKSIDIERYTNKVQSLIDKQSKKSLLDGLYIKTPNCEGITTSINDEDFIILMEVIKYGSKKGKALLESNLTPELIGYIKYLEEYKDMLEGKELEQLEMLTAWLC